MMVFKDWRVRYITLVFNVILVQRSGTHRETSSLSYREMSEACRIFCRGKLLQYVQMSRIFNDSKHFVDMKLRNSPDETENRFNDLLFRTKDSPSRAEMKEFVGENFEEPGKEFETWNPDDWIPMPKFTYDIYDRDLRNWIREVNKIWKSLGRKMSSDVDKNGNLYSQIYVPNPFIVPGGRFTELYYWDSYWIIEGLLLSEMQSTAKGMIENFLYLVKKYGYIPNGSRLYYLGRSQPPFLISMMDLYWQHTKDATFLKESIDILETEFNFWLTNRSQEITIDGSTHRLFHYKVLSADPRPESYYEDMNLFNNVTDGEAKSKIFSEMKSGAESGWDFSTRWFLSNGERSTNLSDISILSIAPVCLNSLMGLNAKIMSQFYHILENEAKHKEYKDMAKAANITMSRVFWSDRDGVWLDFNMDTKERIPGFYPSNLMPLWTDSFGEERDPEFVIEQAIAYLERNHIFDYPGGIPASLIQSGQQWDMPNGWAPLQYFVVMGFNKAGKYNSRAKDISFSLARDWVLNVYQTYLNSNPPAIFEKYNVTARGMSGGGGEYKIQEGFGWTNAVVMKFLSIYGHKIKTQDVFDPAPLAMGLLLMLVSVAAVINYMHRIQVFKRLTCKVEV